MSHSQGSILIQLSWSWMLMGANPPGCLPPKQAGQPLAGHLQSQPTGKLSPCWKLAGHLPTQPTRKESQHSCTLDPDVQKEQVPMASLLKKPSI